MMAATALSMLLLSQSTWTEVKLAQSCLTYADCSTEVFAFPDAGEGKYILSVKGMDALTVQARLTACGLGEALAGKVRTSGGQPLEIQKLRAPIVEAPRPAGLSAAVLEQNRAVLNQTIRLGMTDPAKAGQSMMALFGVAEAGYQVVADPSVADGVAETNHQARTIRMNPRYSTSCAFWWAIRHELEHVAQLRFAKQCANASKRSVYLSQSMREYDAYLGDLAYAGFACKGSWLNQVESTAYPAMRTYLKRRIEELKQETRGNPANGG